MRIFRIVKSAGRVRDLSGTGAFQAGGRWNNPGSYVLYTSENSSLAFLEILVHVGPDEMPTDLHIVELEIDDEVALVYTLPDSDYPDGWFEVENLACKHLGDAFFAAREYLVLKVRSAVNPAEYNYLLNPLFPGYHDLLQFRHVSNVPVDRRLGNR